MKVWVRRQKKVERSTAFVCTVRPWRWDREKQRQQQTGFWIAHTELPRSVGHPFYERLNQVLEERKFDEFVEARCERFYAEGMGRRGELLERSFAHAYETGGTRRVYLRGRENVRKRLLIHVGALNLSFVMRKLWGKGTPRGWQGYLADAVLAFLRFWMTILAQAEERIASPARRYPSRQRKLQLSFCSSRSE